jgi:hypothetical protein
MSFQSTSIVGSSFPHNNMPPAIPLVFCIALQGIYPQRQADGRGVKASIHVERFNPAQRLYTRLGFRPRSEAGIYLLLERPPRVAGQAKSAS